MNISSFQKQGQTFCLAVTSTAHTPVQVKGVNTHCTQYMVHNSGTVPVFIATAAPLASGAAPTMAVGIPADGTPANGLSIPAGALMVITAEPDAYFSAISSTSAFLYITPGDGKL